MFVHTCTRTDVAHTLHRMATLIEEGGRLGAADVLDKGADGKALRHMMKNDLKDVIELLCKIDKGCVGY